MQLIDTHCHIHEANYPLDIGDVLARAHHAGVNEMICVGTSAESSEKAIEFATQHEQVYASVGVHPHDTKEGWEGLDELFSRFRTSSAPAFSASSHAMGTLSKHLQPEFSLMNAQGEPRVKPFTSGTHRNDEHGNENIAKIIAVGEIGLDYFYTHSPRETQIKALEWQINLALNHNLPIIFHVRDAFEDFWPIFDNFPGIKGELHSFTDTKKNLEEALKRGLYIGINGISTFTKDETQKEMFRLVPLEKMLLETDAPFLTPVPSRGKVNEPAFVRHIAEFHAISRGISLEEIAATTTANARALFALP